MTVSGLVKSSLVDYPGLVSCVLFVPGCNYSCFYCHNRALLDQAPPALSMQKVEAFLKKRAGLLDAAVVSGGEPTCQAGLEDFLRFLKSLGYKVKLDTNGSNPQAVDSILRGGLCDYAAVDYKAPAARYGEICGGSAGPVLETIGILLKARFPFEVRTTVVPQLSAEDLMHMAQELPPVPRYVLNRYRKPEKYLPEDRDRVEKTPYTPGQVKAFAALVRPYQPGTVL